MQRNNRATYTMLSRPLALGVIIALLITACGNGGRPAKDGATGGGEAVADAIDLSGVEVAVGSKEFTEQQIVGQMALLALEAAGAKVDDRAIGLQGTQNVRGALEQGRIDMYWEYTGTGWIEILQQDELLEGSDAYYQQVKEADAANGVVWLRPSEVNNTYALFVGPNVNLGIETLSDLAALARENPDQATLCAATEFIIRPDGLSGVTEAYNFEFSQVNELALNLAINAAIQGQRCTVGEIFRTNPQILQQNLNVLEDDQEFFPAYNLAMTIRQDAYEQHTQAYDTLFGAITDLLDNETMIELNGQREVEGQSFEDIAREFLVSNGIISE